MAPLKRGIAKMQGQAFVGGQLVMEAEMSASIVRKEHGINVRICCRKLPVVFHLRISV